VGSYYFLALSPAATYCRNIVQLKLQNGIIESIKFLSVLEETFWESALKTLPVFLQFVNTPTIEVFTFGGQKNYFKI
jgi:E3 ubiquitin-protein ligase DOA10